MEKLNFLEVRDAIDRYNSGARPMTWMSIFSFSLINGLFVLNYGKSGDGKCLDINTNIKYADGSNYKIKELLKELPDKKILSLNTNTLKLEEDKIVKVFKTGIKKLYTLKTSSGREINATDNHPFFTPDGWKRLDELKDNDFIATPRILRIGNRNDYSIETMKTIGYIIGDGSIGSSIRFTKKNQEEINCFFNAASKEFTIKEFKTKGKSSRDFCLIGAGGFFDDLGLRYKTAGYKFIPDILKQQKKENIIALLDGLFSTDGTVATNKSNQVEYSSKSKQLCLDVQEILLKLNILSQIRSRKVKGYTDTYYDLLISGGDIIKFNKIIKLDTYKGESQKILTKKMEQKKRNPNNDLIPNGAKLFKKYAKEMKEYGMIFNQIRKRDGCKDSYMGIPSKYTRGINKFSRNKFKKIAEYYNEEEMLNHANSDILWEKIKSVEYNRTDDVYDIEVEKNHNFIANNIIVHNSHSSTELAKLLGVYNSEAKDENGRLTCPTIIAPNSCTDRHFFDFLSMYSSCCIIIDDASMLTKKQITFLKEAMGESAEVEYTTSRDDKPNRFKFKGTIIINTNYEKQEDAINTRSYRNNFFLLPDELKRKRQKARDYVLNNQWEKDSKIWKKITERIKEIIIESLKQNVQEKKIELPKLTKDEQDIVFNVVDDIDNGFFSQSSMRDDFKAMRVAQMFKLFFGEINQDIQAEIEFMIRHYLTAGVLRPEDEIGKIIKIYNTKNKTNCIRLTELKDILQHTYPNHNHKSWIESALVKDKIDYSSNKKFIKLTDQHPNIII